MSGFFCLLQADGAEVDATDLARIAAPVRRHGDGECAFQVHECLAVGLAPLHVGAQAGAAEAPLSVDGHWWITGDARLDRREALVTALRSGGDAGAVSGQSDLELLARAFQLWDAALLDRVSGEFAFVLANAGSREVFAARDAFGIRPLFYAEYRGCIVLANDFDAVRELPGLQTHLEEPVIADFLALGYPLDESATILRGIRRLPPGHLLRRTRTGVTRTRSYDPLRVTSTVCATSPYEYKEAYRELLLNAVADRLPRGPACFELSGGMDSTSVTALAARLGADVPGFQALALTTDNPADAEDREFRTARLLASQLGMRHQRFEAARRGELFADNDTAQPVALPFVATLRRFAGEVRRTSSVLLTGQGGDVFLEGSGSVLLDLWRERSPAGFIRTVLGDLVRYRTLRGLGWRAFLFRNAPRLPMPPLPRWLDRSRLERAGTFERWHALFHAPGRFPPACVSEFAWDQARMPFWSYTFETQYHDLMRGIDCRHPLFDLALVRFLMQVPGGLKHNKGIARAAMRDALPEEVRLRPKSGPVRSLVADALDWPGRPPASTQQLAPTAAWLDLPAYVQAMNSGAYRGEENLVPWLAPLSLQNWLSARAIL